MTESRYLFTPLGLGPVTVPNRIVFAAHLTNYASAGLPTEQHAAYYGARAAGGTGLIIAEEQCVHRSDRAYEKVIRGYDRAAIAGYRTITEAVHAHGVPVFAQLNHNGGQASSMLSRQAVWAPSPIADPLFREVPKQVTAAEISELVAGYAQVARHCIEGGFDGVELQCSQSSILRGFLSGATNIRDDQWGGSLPNRARMLLHVIAAVREAIGPDRALGVRLCGDELIEGGITIDEAVQVAVLVEATGAVDYLNTAIGVATSTLHMIEASMQIPRGYALFIPSAIRAAVSLPVIGVGRFKDAAQAEQALADGHCDLVGVVRGQIADPDFAAKARAGRDRDVRTCLSCNQECVGRMGRNRWLGCLENPAAGREVRRTSPSAGSPSSGLASSAGPAKSAAKRILVVGGGPGGLQAAVTAAERGHHVRLSERSDRLGGQAALAATVPSRAEFGDLVRNLATAARRLGVQIETGRAVSAADIVGAAPDVLVLATGARPRRAAWAAGFPRVVDVRDVLGGQVDPAGSVTVVDELGFHEATSVAELLADRGCAVEIVTSAMTVGADLDTTLDLRTWNVKADLKSIRQRTDVVVSRCSDSSGRLVLTLEHHPTGASIDVTSDWVVCVLPAAVEDQLWKELRPSGLTMHRIGDCLAPRRAHAAVIEGERVGALL